jgi:hypothetical protein
MLLLLLSIAFAQSVDELILRADEAVKAKQYDSALEVCILFIFRLISLSLGAC